MTSIRRYEGHHNILQHSGGPFHTGGILLIARAIAWIAVQCHGRPVRSNVPSCGYRHPLHGSAGRYLGRERANGEVVGRHNSARNGAKSSFLYHPFRLQDADTFSSSTPQRMDQSTLFSSYLKNQARSLRSRYGRSLGGKARGNIPKPCVTRRYRDKTFYCVVILLCCYV
jgi:hypothetical protein